MPTIEFDAFHCIWPPLVVHCSPGCGFESCRGQILECAVARVFLAQDSWGLLAAGTGHGFLLFDYQQNKPVMHKCTLNPNGEPPPLMTGVQKLVLGVFIEEMLRVVGGTLRGTNSERYLAHQGSEFSQWEKYSINLTLGRPYWQQPYGHVFSAVRR